MGAGERKKGGIEEKQREGTGSLDSWSFGAVSKPGTEAAQGDREQVGELLM